MQLYSRTLGAGEDALVILHGLFGSSANWQSLAKRFGQKRTVYTLDLRNHGRSPWSDTMTYQAMAEDVFSFIEQLDHPHITLLGHSMGGKAAMQMALSYPDSIDALIVADVAPVRYEHDFDQLLNAMLALELDTLSNRTQADTELQTDIPDAGVRAFLLHNLSYDKENQRWAWRPNLNVISDTMENITQFDENEGKRYSKPTLFIHGALSNYVTEDYQPKINKLFPGVEYAKIEMAGHWLHAEQPKYFLNACEEFLS